MKYERDYFIHFHDTDDGNKLSIISLMKYFEEVALLQSDELGVGIDFYNKNNVGWLLLKWDISVKHYPVFREKIKIKTIPAAFKGSFANREYYVFDSSGNQIAEANTLWIFMDRNTKKPARILPEIYNKYHPTADSMKEFTKLGEVPTPESMEHTKKIIIRQDDIDMNNHVNNRRYAEWAMEQIPDSIKQELSLSRFRISYRKEVMFEDNIESILEINKNENEVKCIHGIMKGSEIVCNMESIWTKNIFGNN